MKTCKMTSICCLVSFVLTATFLRAQDMRPEYVVLTHSHWNMELGYDESLEAEWETLEKEYLEKVTKKNEHVMASLMLTHMYTPDNSDVVFISTYKSWADIEQAQKRSMELEAAAWPDEADRKAFFQKLDRFYENKHADEIYRTLDGARPPAARIDTPVVVYMQKVYLTFPEDGTPEEFEAVRMEYAKNVIHKNPHIKAYFPMRHAWGSDNRELVHVYILESLCDVSAMSQATRSLIDAAWPDKTKRDAFFKKYDKYFSGKHGDFLYASIPAVAK